MSIYDRENWEHDKYGLYLEKKENEEILAKCETNLADNKTYNFLMQDYLRCTQFYLEEYPMSFLLEQQLTRSDLDTVCAYELYQLKKAALNTDLLDFKHFIKKQ